MYFGSWDTTALFALNGFAGRSSLIDGIIIFTATYLPYIVVALVALYLYRKQRFSLNQKIRAMAFALAAALIARIGIGSPIRFFFPRPRPFITYHLHQLIAEHSPGFPSGHALFFFAFSTVAYAYNRTLGVWCYLLTMVICLARVAAGIHYPSDILAGAVLGILCGYLCVMVGRRYRIIS